MNWIKNRNWAYIHCQLIEFKVIDDQQLINKIEFAAYYQRFLIKQSMMGPFSNQQVNKDQTNYVIVIVR